MNVRTIVDTGPLVALLKADDSLHPWAVGAFEQLPADGMVTCEAVVSEVCFLLGRWPVAIDALFERIADRALRLIPMEGESAAVHAVMKKYRTVPASYADACLVRMSELFTTAPVVTTDPDFSIYRRNRRQSIPTVEPAQD